MSEKRDALTPIQTTDPDEPTIGPALPTPCVRCGKTLHALVDRKGYWHAEKCPSCNGSWWFQWLRPASEIPAQATPPAAKGEPAPSLLTWTFEPTPALLAIGGVGREVLTFHADGRVEVGPGLTPDDAATAFVEALRPQFAEMLRQERERFPVRVIDVPAPPPDTLFERVMEAMDREMAKATGPGVAKVEPLTAFERLERAIGYLRRSAHGGGPETLDAVNVTLCAFDEWKVAREAEPAGPVQRDVDKARAFDLIIDGAGPAIAHVLEERRRQEEKWGRHSCPSGGWGTGRSQDVVAATREKAATDAAMAAGTCTFRDVLIEEVAEALATDGGSAEQREELVQVAAVAVKWAWQWVGVRCRRSTSATLDRTSPSAWIEAIDRGWQPPPSRP